mgnify:CR=1 FL=1
MDESSVDIRLGRKIIIFIVILLILVFTVCITYQMSRSLKPVEVEFVASEGYRALYASRVSRLRTYYVHYYQGVVDGELITFTEPDMLSSKGYNRTILVNLENPSEYEMYSSKYDMLLHLLIMNIPIIIAVVCCIWLLTVFRNGK